MVKNILNNILLTITATMVAVGAFFVVCTDTASAQANMLTVGAGHSLKGAFRELIPLFEKEHGAIVRVVYGSSQTLRRGFEQGESIDVILPEADQDLEVFDKKGITRNSKPQVYARSSLVLVMPASPKATMTAFYGEASNRPIRIAVADPQASTLGKVTARVISKLRTAFQKRLDLVYVRHPEDIVNVMKSGGADLGIVYRVDAITNSDKVVIVDETLGRMHPPVQFGQAVVVGNSKDSVLIAKEFSNFIMSPRIQKLLLHHGFDPVPVK